LGVVRLLRRCIEEQESNDGDRKDEGLHSQVQSLRDASKEIGRLGRTAVIRPLFTPRSCLPFQLMNDEVDETCIRIFTDQSGCERDPH
jgi:hypothetical protein